MIGRLEAAHELGRKAVAQNRPTRTIPKNIHTNNPEKHLHEQSRTISTRRQLEIHLQACKRRFREFGAISGTYQNPPCSKPWALAQAFVQNRPISDPCENVGQALGTKSWHPRGSWEDNRNDMADTDEHTCLGLLHWIFCGIDSVATQRCCRQPQGFIMGQNSEDNLPDPR